MISAPVVNVQCDQVDIATGERCRRAQALVLPTFESDRASVRALFLTLHPEWGIIAECGLVFCPNCRRIADRMAEEEGATR
jgi:hypothetical protein